MTYESSRALKVTGAPQEGQSHTHTVNVYNISQSPRHIKHNEKNMGMQIAPLVRKK